MKKESSKKKSDNKKTTAKKPVKKKSVLKDKNFLIGVGIIGILLILAGIIIFTKNPIAENQENNFNSEISDVLTQEISPLELSQNKEEYKGKTVLVLGAYIPSEAFIYIQETKDKIYLKPVNKAYCRNYNLQGVLEYNLGLSKWEFYPENYNDCLD